MSYSGAEPGHLLLSHWVLLGGLGYDIEKFKS